MSNARESVIVNVNPSLKEYTTAVSQIHPLRNSMFTAGYGSHIVGPAQNGDGTVSWVGVPGVQGDHLYGAFLRQFVNIMKTVPGAHITLLCSGGADKAIKIHASTDYSVSGQIESIIT